MADFNRLHKGHIGTAPKSAFNKKSQEDKSTDWSVYVTTQLKAWEALHNLWLSKFPGPAYIVSYETLVKDTRNTLQGILNFLNVTVTEDDMKCALLHKEGIYRRKNKHQNFDPFTQDMYQRLHVVKERVLRNIQDYRRKVNDTNIAKDIF
ncbi:unnamed protein product, partial [Iphiclides podalirius]